ncbi:MAG: pre-peptidase [Isosphaeraceae bacterium]
MNLTDRTRTAALIRLVGVVLLLALVRPAEAQRRRQQGNSLPQPGLQSILPLGVTIGGSTEITLRGTDLEGVSGLWFDHPGLSATLVKGTTFKVTCAPGTPPGLHDVRATSPYGISNPRVIVVSTHPEISEVEPNNTPDKATELPINASVSGELASLDVDCFAVTGKKGQRLLFDVQAERVDSRLDATLHLLDASGRELAESRDTLTADPFLDLTLPADGRYVVRLHDVTYRGSNDYTYRLNVTDGPYLDAIVPNVAHPGEAATFTLYGRNLGGTPVPGLSIEGRGLEKKTVTITPPRSLDLDPAYPSGESILSAAAPRRGFEYAIEGPSGRSNALFIALTNDPILVDTEPNDDTRQAQKVSLPCEISGSFGAPGDLDVFQFRARKGEIWWVEATAERIGSAADPMILIQRVNDKGETSDLSSAEDQPDRGGQVRFHTATVDAAVRWQVPEDGTYQVAVNDLYGSQRGDVRLAYRLAIRAERPDFHLFVLPDSATQPDALTIHAGGRAMGYVFALRSDGFTGPIRVEATELPAGVTMSPVVIPTGQSLAPLVFEATESAAPAAATIRLVGRARFGDRKEDLAQGFPATLGPDLTHPALGGGLIWPPEGNAQQQPNNTPARARLTRGFPLKITGPAPLTIQANPAVIRATPGSLLTLDVTVRRREGFAEAVALSQLAPLPSQSNPPTVTIAKEASTGQFAFTLPRSINKGVYPIVLQGTGPFPFSKDPKAKTKPNVTLTEPSNLVTLVIQDSPVNVSAKLVGTLRPGGTAEVEVTVTPKNKSETPGPYTIQVVPPTSFKVTSTTATTPPETPVKVTLKAAPDSPVVAATPVAVRVNVTTKGTSFELNEPLNLAIVK